MRKKISVIGAGNVGASLVELIARDGLADVVISDIAEGVPQGKALDMSQACALWGSSSSITGTNGFEETADSDIIVITAGLARKPGMSRDDLLKANATIISSVTEQAAKQSPDSVIIMVTNPMDVMADVALKVSGFDSDRVIGMGGVLDSSRFCCFVAWELGVSIRDVVALVMGGHGDSMVPMPRFTTVKGVSITELISEDKINELIKRTQSGGAEIVAHLKTGSAFYAPAASTYDMVRSVLLDEKRVLPCSVMLKGQYGIDGVFAGVPVVLGSKGAEKVIELKLTDKEAELLKASAEAVDELVKNI